MAREWISVPKDLYEKVCNESTKSHVLKDVLTEARDIESLLMVFQYFNIRPHGDLLYQIEQKDIPVSDSLLRLWEREDGTD